MIRKYIKMPLSSLVIALGHSLRSVNFIEVHCYGNDLNSVREVSKLFSTDNIFGMDTRLFFFTVLSKL